MSTVFLSSSFCCLAALWSFGSLRYGFSPASSLTAVLQMLLRLRISLPVLELDKPESVLNSHLSNVRLLPRRGCLGGAGRIRSSSLQAFFGLLLAGHGANPNGGWLPSSSFVRSCACPLALFSLNDGFQLLFGPACLLRFNFKMVFNLRAETFQAAIQGDFVGSETVVPAGLLVLYRCSSRYFSKT